jgi:hypothetical protein
MQHPDTRKPPREGGGDPDRSSLGGGFGETNKTAAPKKIAQSALADEAVSVDDINEKIAEANFALERARDGISDANWAIEAANDLIADWNREHPDAFPIDEIDELDVQFDEIDEVSADDEIDEG